jgi:hypothetical protein
MQEANGTSAAMKHNEVVSNAHRAVAFPGWMKSPILNNFELSCSTA